MVYKYLHKEKLTDKGIITPKSWNLKLEIFRLFFPKREKGYFKNWHSLPREVMNFHLLNQDWLSV